MKTPAVLKADQAEHDGQDRKDAEMCSIRLRAPVDSRLVLPRLLQTIRHDLRDRGLTGNPLAAIRPTTDPRFETLTAELYLDLPVELRIVDRGLAGRLCLAAAATATPVVFKTPTASSEPMGVAS